MIETALFGFLKTNVPLVGDRVYSSQGLQGGAKPYLVVTKVSAPRYHTHEGAAGLVDCLMQISIFADGYIETKNIAAEIQNALQGFSGTMGAVEVGGAFYQNEVDNYETETDIFHLAVDYKILYKE